VGLLVSAKIERVIVLAHNSTTKTLSCSSSLLSKRPLDSADRHVASVVVSCDFATQRGIPLIGRVL
jgi:hypothetical protein